MLILIKTGVHVNLNEIFRSLRKSEKKKKVLEQY